MAKPSKKYKGNNAHAKRSGLGRIRRASSSKETRINNWSQQHDNDEFLEQHGENRRTSHTGEKLLAKFNKLARKEDDASGTLGCVCGFQGTFTLVRTEDGSELLCEVRSALKKMMRGVKTPLCVGDNIRFDTSDNDDAIDGIITALLPRHNQLARTDSHNRALQHVFAANIDFLVIVASLAMPDLRCPLVDRYLITAHYNSITPIIVINKCDLDETGHDADSVITAYKKLGYAVFATVADAGHTRGITELQQHLSGKTCVFAGQSGVGKSSLINAMYPGFAIRVGVVSDIQQKGKHTTTASRSYIFNDHTTLIDTPGIREFGIPDVTAVDTALYFPEIAPLQSACRYPDCSHSHEPDCAVKNAVENGDIHQQRYESYLSIIEEL